MLVDTFDTPGIAGSIWGDGQYIYVEDDSSFRIYSGFECTRADTSIDRTYEGDQGVDSNYRAYIWGRETQYSLGDGGGAVNTDKFIPGPIVDQNEFVQMDQYGYGGCGIKSNGEAWCWGRDNNDELGDGISGQVDQDRPIKVVGNHKGMVPILWFKRKWYNLVLGWRYALFIRFTKWKPARRVM